METHHAGICVCIYTRCNWGKEKHLMALCIGVSDHCQPCTLGHLKAAIDAGASKEEILEAIGVVISMRGTTSMGGAWMVFQYMSELEML